MTSSRPSTFAAFGSLDPEDVAYDLVTPGLWIIDGANAQVYHLLPGANGRFDGVAPDGDDVLSQFDTRRLGIIDPEGIYRDPATGDLILTSADPTKLYEVSTAGALVRTFDVSAAHAIKLAGVVMAPSSTAAGVTNFYLVDRAVDNNDDSRENDGRIYEFYARQNNAAYAGPESNSGTAVANSCTAISNTYTATVCGTGHQRCVVAAVGRQVEF